MINEYTIGDPLIAVMSEVKYCIEQIIANGYGKLKEPFCIPIQ